jgi:ABC-type phosphate transport system permease subunit
VQPLAHSFKLRLFHFAAKPEQLRSAPMPFALNTMMLVIVIAVFEMPLGIPDTARHGPYSQHKLTLALFEFRMQEAF